VPGLIKRPRFSKKSQNLKLMISLRKTVASELKQISDMGYQTHVGSFLNQTSLEKHKHDFNNTDVIYLSVLNTSGKLAGYVIIHKKKQFGSIQLKRILIDENYLGIGTEVIEATEQYCARVLNATRLWLDVYVDNARAVRVYEKLGYKVFKEGIENKKQVLFYEKEFQVSLN